MSTSLGATLVAAPDANTSGAQYTSLGVGKDQYEVSLEEQINRRP